MKLIASTTAVVTAFVLAATATAKAQPAPVEEAQGQIERAQQQFEHQKQQLAQVEQTVQFAQAANAGQEPPDAPGQFEASVDAFNKVFTYSSSGRGAGQPLIISAGGADPAARANIEEDLNVMSRILNKSLEHVTGRDKQHDLAMGIFVSSFGDSRRPQNIYLDGYGALFLLNVRFPLVAPLAKEEEKNEKPVDTAWEQTKRELYGPHESNRNWNSSSQPMMPAVEYDADRVDNLKKELLEALKNASNIRNIKSSESITIAVTGSANAGGSRVAVGRAGAAMMDPEMAKRYGLIPSRPSTAKAPTPPTSGEGDRNYKPRLNTIVAKAASGGSDRRDTTLTIRVKKSDADDFAKGKLSFEEFQKKAAISTY